jgi:hypothetical protein
MLIRRGIIHKVQMLNQYESVSVTAEITVDTEEFPAMDPEVAFDKVDELLGMAIENDLSQARKLSDDDSYVRDWK